MWNDLRKKWGEEFGEKEGMNCENDFGENWDCM